MATYGTGGCRERRRTCLHALIRLQDPAKKERAPKRGDNFQMGAAGFLGRPPIFYQGSSSFPLERREPGLYLPTPGRVTPNLQA